VSAVEGISAAFFGVEFEPFFGRFATIAMSLDKT
jgi:hypothetical protein